MIRLVKKNERNEEVRIILFNFDDNKTKGVVGIKCGDKLFICADFDFQD